MPGARQLFYDAKVATREEVQNLQRVAELVRSDFERLGRQDPNFISAEIYTAERCAGCSRPKVLLSLRAGALQHCVPGADDYERWYKGIIVRVEFRPAR